MGGVALIADHLLMVRRANPPEAGKWSIPGGRVEPGETLREAVEREVREETGLRVECGAFMGWTERIGSEHHFVILDFYVEPEAKLGEMDEPRAGGDASEAAWVSVCDLPELDLVRGLIRFLEDHGVLSTASTGRDRSPWAGRRRDG